MSSNDAVYIWVAQGENAEKLCKAFAPEGHVLVKFGVTSQHLGQNRLKHVAKRYSFTARIVRINPVSNALKVESLLLAHGKKAVGVYGDGSTEFRFVDEPTLRAAVALADSYSCGDAETPQSHQKAPPKQPPQEPLDNGGRWFNGRWHQAVTPPSKPKPWRTSPDGHQAHASRR